MNAEKGTKAVPTTRKKLKRSANETVREKKSQEIALIQIWDVCSFSVTNHLYQ